MPTYIIQTTRCSTVSIESDHVFATCQLCGSVWVGDLYTYIYVDRFYVCVRFFSRFLRVKGLKKWGWVRVWSGLTSLVWTLKSDGLKGQVRPVHMSTSNLSHALTLVLSNHLEIGISHQVKAPTSLTLTHQSPTSYWLHHVCMYFRYSVFLFVFLFFIFLPFLYWANGKW